MKIKIFCKLVNYFMKAFLSLILFLSLTFVGFAQQDYPDSGFTNKAEAKNLMVNGLKEGKWVEYDTTTISVLSSKTDWYWLIVYKDSKAYGVAREYYYKGNLIREMPYRDGKENGVGKTYYMDGKLDWEIPVKDSLENGLAKEYAETGTLLFEAMYINGKESGIEKKYYKNGKLKSETIYTRGEAGTTKTYDENGNEIK
jgi:antitoxin component YwqK of YwqJK toxin-antitoxin module